MNPIEFKLPPGAPSFRSLSVEEARPELMPVLQAHPTWTIEEAQAFVAGEGWMLFRAEWDRQVELLARQIAGR